MDEHQPTLFSKVTPPVTVAYFNGPWLPMCYTDEFIRYSYDLDYPLKVLTIKKRRENIIKGLNEMMPPLAQASLFENSSHDIEQTFGDFLNISQKGKGLYYKWKQDVKGKTRNLVKAKTSLDFFLRNYALPIIMQAPCHPQVHGGEAGWNVKRSLETHLPLGSVLSFDLEKAFNNVHGQYVFDFYYHLFEERIEKPMSRDLAGFLTHISTVYEKNSNEAYLPQGSPISIQLFNRLLYPIDEMLAEKAKKRNLHYSRWIDDMIISAPENNRRFDKMAGVMKILREDFPIRLDKVFWQKNIPTYYLLGHRILGNIIAPVSKEESLNRGQPIELEYFSNQREFCCGFDDWTLDDDSCENNSLDNTNTEKYHLPTIRTPATLTEYI